MNCKGAEALIMKQAVSHGKAPEELASYRKRKAATMEAATLSKA